MAHMLIQKYARPQVNYQSVIQPVVQQRYPDANFSQKFQQSQRSLTPVKNQKYTATPSPLSKKVSQPENKQILFNKYPNQVTLQASQNALIKENKIDILERQVKELESELTLYKVRNEELRYQNEKLLYEKGQVVSQLFQADQNPYQSQYAELQAVLNKKDQEINSLVTSVKFWQNIAQAKQDLNYKINMKAENYNSQDNITFKEEFEKAKILLNAKNVEIENLKSEVSLISYQQRSVTPPKQYKMDKIIDANTISLKYTLKDRAEPNSMRFSDLSNVQTIRNSQDIIRPSETRLSQNTLELLKQSKLILDRNTGLTIDNYRTSFH